MGLSDDCDIYVIAAEIDRQVFHRLRFGQSSDIQQVERRRCMRSLHVTLQSAYNNFSRRLVGPIVRGADPE
jgi:hypothetical protein